MALSQRLQIRQSQGLVMTPQLMQAIKLLQLSNVDVIPHYSEWAANRGGSRSDYNLEGFLAAEATLAQHLTAQLALVALDPAQKLIGEYLIGLMDENGYVPADLSGVRDKLGAS